MIWNHLKSSDSTDFDIQHFDFVKSIFGTKFYGLQEFLLKSSNVVGSRIIRPIAHQSIIMKNRHFLENFPKYGIFFDIKMIIFGVDKM